MQNAIVWSIISQIYRLICMQVCVPCSIRRSALTLLSLWHSRLAFSSSFWQSVSLRSFSFTVLWWFW